MKALFHPLLVGIAFSLTAGAQAFAADLPSDFAEAMKQSKGPFGKNVLQGATERVPVTVGRVPAEFQFQAAYRTEAARALITNYQFYTGNLFTTNYYELQGEFVYGNPDGNHPLDHAALAANAAAALPKANRIVLHWALEKYSIGRLPNAKLSRSFRIRGISSFESELEYARHFFNFYLGAMDPDFGYLPAYLLATGSPISDSASLGRARILVATAYDEVALVVGANDPMVRELYRLRNAIHNQLTPGIVAEIDAFLRKYPHYRNVPAPPPTPLETPNRVLLTTASEAVPDRDDLDQVRAILADYFSFSATKVARQAAAAGRADIRRAAETLARGGATPANLLALSAVGATHRRSLNHPSVVPVDQRAATISVLVNVANLVKRELATSRAPFSRELAEAALNIVYLEGLIIQDNWVYFRRELDQGADARKVLADLVDVASDGLLNETFAFTLDEWASIEPKMRQFTDHVLKSSALDAVAKLIKQP